MGHAIQAFVAREEVLRPATARLRNAVVVRLEQGFALLPVTSEVYDEAGGGELPHEEWLWSLSQPLARLGAELSAAGPVGYVETDYHGGEGDQGAIVWSDGAVVFGPERRRWGAVNDALLELDVVTGGATDRFEALGLHRHRNNDDWAAEARPPA